MKQLFSAALVLLAAPMCFAALLQLEAGPANIEGVNLAKTATVMKDGSATNIDLPLLGAGLRAKKVLVMTVKVYVAQAFGDVQRYVRDDAGSLPSLETMPNVAMRLTFLRTVDAATVQNSFREALGANQIDLNRTDVAAFLRAVSSGGDATSGRSMEILFQREGSKEIVTYEGTDGRAQAVEGQAGFIRSLLSIWYGRPSDDGVARLKSELLVRREGY